MRNNESRLAFLFRQYLAGSLSMEDRQSFFHLVADDRSEEELKELIEKEIELIEPGASVYGNHLTDDQADLIFHHIIAGRQPGTHKRKLVRLAWAGAAAAALFTLVAGIYFFSQTSATPTVVARQQPTHDVAPGTDGAILILANGQQIVLDSLHNGNIASQGQSSVTKNGNGIAYRPDEAGAGVVYNTLSTPRARQFQLTLPDGTRVWLNAASSITFPTSFTGAQRIVTVSGETYFEVSHRDQQPFFVQYGNKKVEVTGTHFNVNAYDEESDSRVTLLQGAVTIHNGGNADVLKPGQQAILNKTNEDIRVTADVDIDEVMAWKDGHFDFRETSLQTLMRQLMRWYDVDVEYQQGVPQRYFTADISRDKTLASVLKILELNKVHFRIENKKIIVTP